MDKRTVQLGMHPSTASNKLVKDILWSLVCEVGLDNCYRCNLPMTRDTFSVEHKVPWLDSENPFQLFFDLKNISFSHHSCNVKAARSRPPTVCGRKAMYEKGCRCNKCVEANAKYRKSNYSSDKRSARYKRTGN